MFISHESVDYVLETGLMNGMGKGKFEPDTTLNRAMVATVLYRLSGDKVSATNAFPDVPANEWYGEAVAWAQQKGIVTGFEDGTFRPMEEISRQDMALMLQRYAKTVKGTDTTPTGDLSRWPDAGQVGSWAVDALRWCVGAGIINGKDGGSSRPATPPAQSSRPSSCATRSCNRTKHKGRPSPHSRKDERCSKEYGIAYDHVGYAVSFCSCCEISTTPIKLHHMTKVCFFDRQSFRLLYHSDIIPMLSKRFLGRLEHRKTGFYDPADKMDHFLFAVLVIALHNDMHQTV